MKHCHICYINEELDELYTCDRCEELYCLQCSYTYTYHYQYEGCLCYFCSEQSRVNKLTKEELRQNKLKLIL